MTPNHSMNYEIIKSEMQSMYDNQVWTLVDLSQGNDFQEEDGHGWKHNNIQGKTCSERF
jgi:hypothetical protein